MIKMTQLTVLMLLTQVSFAEIEPPHPEDLAQGTSRTVIYDDTTYFSAEDSSKFDSGVERSKDGSSTQWRGKLGTATVTIDVENTDFQSQCAAEWERRQEKKHPKKKKRSSFRSDRDKEDEEEEEKKNHSPKASFSIEWSSRK